MQHVLWEPEHDGAGPAGARGPIGLRDRPGDARCRSHDLDVLCRRTEHRFEVDLLERLVPLARPRRQPHQQQHRRRIVVGDEHARGSVGRSRPTRHEGDAWRARELARGFRHHCRRSLVPADDGADGPIVEQRIERGEKALAGHGEEHPAALCRKPVDQDLSPVTHHAVQRPGLPQVW